MLDQIIVENMKTATWPIPSACAELSWESRYVRRGIRRRCAPRSISHRDVRSSRSRRMIRQFSKRSSLKPKSRCSAHVFRSTHRQHAFSSSSASRLQVVREREHIALERVNDDKTRTPMTIPIRTLRGSTLRSFAIRPAISRDDFLSAYGRVVALSHDRFFARGPVEMIDGGALHFVLDEADVISPPAAVRRRRHADRGRLPPFECCGHGL